MDFRKYIDILDDISTDHEPQVGDHVSIELGDTLLETYIEDITEDGVVIKVDETALSLLIAAKKQLNENMRMGASTEPIEESKCEVCGMDPCDCDHEEVDEEKRGLWANIHAKRERIKHGSGEKMRKPGSKGAPSAQDFKDSQKTSKNEGVSEDEMDEAKYQGREVPLGKPMAGDVKKSKVYVKGPKGNVVKVNFGDKNMRIKKSNPSRRKSFRARHNCDNPGPRWKARYWSCRAW